jgi:hypothetical protein
MGMKSGSKFAGRGDGSARAARGTTVSRAIEPPAKATGGAERVLDAEALNVRLLGGQQLSIREANGEVVRCDVVGTGELVAPEMFDDYLARGLIQEMEHSYRFGISNDGRRRLR